MSLPSGYKKLEYIQSSGTQYIDTGFQANNNTRVTATIEVMDVSATCYLFGCRDSQSDSYKNRYGIINKTGGILRSDYGDGSGLSFSTKITNGLSLSIDKNKAKCSVNSKTVTNTAATFQSRYSIGIFAINEAGTGAYRTSMKLFSFQIYDNDTLVRDFIPCKNSTGAIGLWDDVNSAFYANAGTGVFAAGAEIVEDKDHKVLIDGTEHIATKITMLVDGTGYKTKKGRVLIDGTGYDIPFASGTPISDLPVGSVVKISVNGALREFLIVNQGLPSSIYDTSCDGTWLLMKDIYTVLLWNATDSSKLAGSMIIGNMNNGFLNLIDSSVKDAIKQVKIPYLTEGGNYGYILSGANGLDVKIFPLSGFEVGLDKSISSGIPEDGAKLSYFETGAGTSANNKRIAYMDGAVKEWWLRSPMIDRNVSWYVHYIRTYGNNGSTIANYASYGARPAFILPFDTVVTDDGIILG